MSKSQPEAFKLVQSTPESAILEIRGFGTLKIARDDTKVSVSIFDFVDDHPLFHQTIMVEEALPGYEVAVSRLITGFLPQSVNDAWIEEQFRLRQTPDEAARNWYLKEPLMLSRLLPLKGTFAEYLSNDDDFVQPYYPLTETQRQALVLRKADFFLAPGGRVVSYGAHGAEPVLMPVASPLAARLKKDNKEIIARMDNHHDQRDNPSGKE